MTQAPTPKRNRLVLVSAAILFVIILVFGPSILYWNHSLKAQPVTLDVDFTLLDPEGKPLPATSARIVFGSDEGWQNPGTGYRVVTDAEGKAKVSVPVVLDRHWRKMPGGFPYNLLSLPMLTDHLKVGAELEYMNEHWLYTLDLVRFPDGTTMEDDASVYTPDEQGRFTIRSIPRPDEWRVQVQGGQFSHGPGYFSSDGMLDVDTSNPAHPHWTLRVGFKKSPPPVQM